MLSRGLCIAGQPDEIKIATPLAARDRPAFPSSTSAVAFSVISSSERVSTTVIIYYAVRTTTTTATTTTTVFYIATVVDGNKAKTV